VPAFVILSATNLRGRHRTPRLRVARQRTVSKAVRNKVAPNSGRGQRYEDLWIHEVAWLVGHFENRNTVASRPVNEKYGCLGPGE